MKLFTTLAFTLLFTSFNAHAAGDPAKGAELKGECIDCHGENGLGDEQYPRIAGLDETYMFETLMAFKNGELPNRAEIMLWFLEDLEEQDLADLAAYYASLKGE